MKQESRIQIGDYVLATKYSDGDPCDQFCVGFVSRLDRSGRFDVIDNDGKSFRHNGFRRAEKITQEEGHQLVKMFPLIGDIPGRSLWWHLGKIRGEENPVDPCESEDGD